MQELNKAYLTLIDDDKRTEYDEGLEGENALELESENANEEVPFEIDEESAKKNKIKIESCSFYLDGGGDIEAIGEIVSTNNRDIEDFIEIHFNVYDSDNKLISATKTYGNRSGKRITFDMYLFIKSKSKSATPAKVKIYFS